MRKWAAARASAVRPKPTSSSSASARQRREALCPPRPLPTPASSASDTRPVSSRRLILVNSRSPESQGMAIGDDSLTCVRRLRARLHRILLAGSVHGDAAMHAARDSRKRADQRAVQGLADMPPLEQSTCLILQQRNRAKRAEAQSHARIRCAPSTAQSAPASPSGFFGGGGGGAAWGGIPYSS